MTRIVIAGIAASILGLAAGGCTPAATAEVERAPAHVSARSQVAAGEYLTTLGGCNDCHTPGWFEKGGRVPSEERLTGSPVGFRGPWGTTYPPNLRLSARRHTARSWVAMIRARNDRPPMPWMNLHAMSDADLEAIHAYLLALGPKGHPAPDYVPPDREPTTPYIVFAPVMPAASR